MNYGELQLKVAKYVMVDSVGITAVPANLSLVIKQAINAARKWAERDHDFDCYRTTVRGVVPVTGAGLDWQGSLTGFYDSPTTYKLKIIEQVYLVGNDDGLFPIRHFNKKVHSQKVMDEPDYGGEETEAARLGYRTQGLVHGKRLFLTPMGDQNVNVALDGVAWASDYSADGDTDWIMDHGSDFLFWRAVVEVNHATKIYVYRQEGNLQPPEKMADLAYATLVQLDSYIAEGNLNYDRE